MNLTLALATIVSKLMTFKFGLRPGRASEMRDQVSAVNCILS